MNKREFLIKLSVILIQSSFQSLNLSNETTGFQAFPKQTDSLKENRLNLKEFFKKHSVPKLNEHIEKTLNMQESQRLSIVIILKP